jgi:hypothetical protein
MSHSVCAIQRFLRPARRVPQTILRWCLMVAALPLFAAVVGCLGFGRHDVIIVNNIQNNALWVANGTDVLEFGPSQLQGASSSSSSSTASNSDPAPLETLSSSVFGSPQGVVFDGFGDLWVIDSGTIATGGTVAPALYEFTVQQLSELSKNSSPTPAVTIQSASFKFPQQAAFDGRGNLWVSDNGSNEVYVFLRSQLATSSTTAIPQSTIVSSVAFNGPIGIAFDNFGDLFVANNVGNTIYGFKASSLQNLNVMSNVTTSNGPVPIPVTPTVMLSNSSGSIQSPWGLAFDGFGNLWSSNAAAGTSTVVEFTRSQFAMTGSPTPNITLSSVAVNSNQTLAAPEGVAFDNFGDLGVGSSAAPFGVAVYAQSQVVKSSSTSPTPDAFLVGSTTTLSAPAGVAFGPVVQ